MALIKLELDYPIENGTSVTFQAPCDCTSVTGIKIYYPNVTETEITTANKTFTFRDCHLNNLNGLGNLFMAGAYVKVVLDVDNGYAFLQNSDTNGHLEGQVTGKILLTDVTVATTDWTASTAHEDYPYQATISVEKANSTMIPEVNFGFADAVAAKFAPVVQSVSGGVVIYAKEVPEADMVIPNVILWY
jgi:hypothetical protein